MLSKISNISFKSTPLYDVRIKKRGEGSSWESVDATFSVLNPNDKNDIDAINKIRKSWWRTKYIGLIKENFKTKTLRKYSTFYALETKGNEPLDKRIVSLCEVSKSPFDFPGCYVEFLQTSPEISKKRMPKYKGAGEVTLYGVTKEAQKENIEYIGLTSSDKASPFYKHIGFKPDLLNYYTISDYEYNNYISRIEDKYAFSCEK